uniref:Amino acid transporter transmembrane domain-containing protein n=1 Tax=Chenopodium quinoa TaxID=63459 RepID=A0A803MC65_CHEQI
MKGEYSSISSLTQPLVEELEAATEANDNDVKSSLQESNTSFFKTLFNCANTILGNGVLIVSYALASGGWSSLILLFAISVASTYTSLLVKRCMESDPRIKTYTHIGEYAFGRIGKIIVSIILYADLYMVSTSFLILEGDNLHNLFPKLSFKALGIAIDGKSSFIILVALVLIPIILLDNLSILAYVSATGVFASVLILASVVWVGAVDGIGFHHGNDPGTGLINWKGIPTAISLYMLCYSSHPVFPALYTSMQRKQDFSKVLLLCFTFSSIIYFQWQFPEGWFSSDYQKNKCFKVTVRMVLLASQVAISLALPFFGYLMSLTGALLCATASLTMPCLCYLKISSTNYGSSRGQFYVE